MFDSNPTNSNNAAWEKFSGRRIPEWFSAAQFGIMIHWGVYSVPAYHEITPNVRKNIASNKIQNGSEWYLRRLFNPRADGPKRYTLNHHKELEKKAGHSINYYDFVHDFTAKEWNPKEWAEVFKKSGAKYVVITSRHHDGFALWPSEQARYLYHTEYKQWNSVKLGPKRDLLKELAEEVRKVGLKFGLYYSLLQWQHPHFTQTSKYGSRFVDETVHPQLKDLVDRYTPDVLWLDGDWNHDHKYWKTENFLMWLYHDSKVRDSVVVNDRCGKGTAGVWGDFKNHSDRWLPDTKVDHHWEHATTMSLSWGFNKSLKLSDWKKPDEILRLRDKVNKFGGNLLLNVSPMANGILPDIEVENLLQIGRKTA